jgi:hypothetical protein
MLAQQA